MNVILKTIVENHHFKIFVLSHDQTVNKVNIRSVKKGCQNPNFKNLIGYQSQFPHKLSKVQITLLSPCLLPLAVWYCAHKFYELIIQAWDLWINDKASELKDPSIAYPSSTSRVRYINIGLLCVQENPIDRPTMSYIVPMLSNDLAALPTPRHPAFVTSRGTMNKNVSTNCREKFSVNGLTVSSIEPR